MLGRPARRRVLWLLSCIGVVVAIAWARPASAYPWMIRHEYQGCVPCHADPSGAGVLTEYGRAMGENVLRSRYGSKPPDEMASYARFLFGVPMPDWLLLHGSIRNGVQFNWTPATPPASGLQLQCTHFDDAGCRFLEMEVDLRAQVTVSRFRAYGTLGWMRQGASPTLISSVPQPAKCGFYVGENGAGSPICPGNVSSREHWIGVDLGEDKEFLLRAGRINVPFGIRQDEHDLLVRSSLTTRTNINESQQYGLALYYGGKIFRGEIMALLGNYLVNPDVFRERGYSGYIEFAVAPKAAFGVSSLVTYAAMDYVNSTPHTIRQVHGVFTRYSPHEVVALLAEADAWIVTTSAGTEPSAIAMLQADVEPVQGLHLIATGETMVQANVPVGTTRVTGASYDGWGAVLWFFAPHADVRFDVVAASVFNGPVSIYALPQLHLYL
jgi:hypothetical protein